MIGFPSHCGTNKCSWRSIWTLLGIHTVGPDSESPVLKPLREVVRSPQAVGGFWAHGRCLTPNQLLICSFFDIKSTKKWPSLAHLLITKHKPVMSPRELVGINRRIFSALWSRTSGNSWINIVTFGIDLNTSANNVKQTTCFHEPHLPMLQQIESPVSQVSLDIWPIVNTTPFCSNINKSDNLTVKSSHILGVPRLWHILPLGVLSCDITITLANLMVWHLGTPWEISILQDQLRNLSASYGMIHPIMHGNT